MTEAIERLRRFSADLNGAVGNDVRDLLVELDRYRGLVEMAAKALGPLLRGGEQTDDELRSWLTLHRTLTDALKEETDG
jgi:hypothetical protein